MAHFNENRVQDDDEGDLFDFAVTHVSLVLQLNLQQSTLTGRADLTIQPTAFGLTQLRLHGQHFDISSVSVRWPKIVGDGVDVSEEEFNAEEQETTFDHRGYVDRLLATDPEVKDAASLKVYYRAALEHSDYGEIFIDVPDTFVTYPTETEGTDLKIFWFLFLLNFYSNS
tara:strand:- start:248 stop:757 length:510 start_codon:yes stop_codon:yes gene_type:complete